MSYLQKRLFGTLIDGGLIDTMCYIQTDDLNPFIRIWTHTPGGSYYLEHKGMSDKYCEKFNDIVREQCRAKYGYKCFLCGMEQRDNNKRLNVHHVDLNKNQGCDNIEFNLVPLCNHCHSKVHTMIWIHRIIYMLTHR